MYEIIKSQDYDRYITALFTPMGYREDIFTAISFNFEVRKILKIISDPMIGMIRFAWWREGVEEAFNLEKNVRNHEILKNLRRLKEKYGMEPDHFYNIVDLRESRLDKNNFKTFDEFKNYLVASDVVMSRITCDIIGITDNNIKQAAQKFALAYGIVDEIRAAMLNFANNNYNMPEDIFIESGAIFEAYGKPHFLESSKEAIEKLLGYARQQITEGRILLEKVDQKEKAKAACPLLMAKVVEFYADHIENNDYDVFSKPIFNELTPLQIVKLSLTNFFGKY